MSRVKGIAFAVSLAGAILVLRGVAWADGQEEETSPAHQLFVEGRELAAAHRFREAARKFLASHALDPAPGTMANLAGAYENMGNVAGAWIAYKETAREAREIGHLDWAARAETSAAQLATNAPGLTLEARAAADIDGIALWVDETELPRRLWSESVPMSQGPHELRAIAPKRRPWSTPFEVDTQHSSAITVPALEPVDEPVTPPQMVLHEPPRADGMGTRRTAALITGGIGAAALAVGTVLGVISLVTYSHSSPDCNRTCTTNGASTRSAAISDANEASLAFAVGGAAALGAGILWFTAPGTGAPNTGVPSTGGGIHWSPKVSTSGFSLTLHGGF